MPAARAGGAGRPEDGGDPVQGAAAAPGPEDLRSPGSARGGAPGSRVELDGKFFRLSGERFLVKGVTWGTFAPDESGYPFPDAAVAARDFATMASLGVNTVRVYTPPRPDLLDLAAEHGLRVMVGIPWAQHVAFLDDRALERETRREVVARVRELAAHPAAFLFALGNEIPPGVVRWHGRGRVERFLRSLWLEAKEAAPEALFTYANFPPLDADSITASAPPTLSAEQKSEDATLTGWTTTFAAGDVLAFNVDSVTTVERVTLSLRGRKT